ncbi:MAG: serine/threonine protein kinase [Anaerolineaceae bacterium]
MGLLQEDQVIRGTWTVERWLGEGAFAEVYRVKHRFLGRQAMKVFKLIGMTMDEVERTLEEAVLLSQLRHPNIISVYDANVTDLSKGMCGFFTMEYVPGGSLDQFWHSHGGQFVPVETAVDIIRQVCRGIAVAHGSTPPLIHRDIKPQNILIGYDGMGIKVRVSDFGLAKHVNPMTLMASARGTPAFKGPEVFTNYQCDSCAGDVWAIGSTLYLLLSDRLPFAEMGEPNLDPTVFKRPIIPPSRLNLNVDASLDQITLKALSIKPEDRYPSAKEFLADLEQWKPRSATAPLINKEAASSDKTKSALGPHSEVHIEEARKMASRAIKVAHDLGKLAEAADLMEEACNKWPPLREKYEYRIKLWRRGLSD